MTFIEVREQKDLEVALTGGCPVGSEWGPRGYKGKIDNCKWYKEGGDGGGLCPLKLCPLKTHV